jgi:CRP/FNR family transcriptional regulator
MKSNSKVLRIPVRRRASGSTNAASVSGEVAQFRTVCANCNLRELCAPCCNLSGAEREIADRLPFTRMHVRRGDCLYRTGDRFSALYAVRKGFFKSLAMIENGREQVTGFSMAGEVLGLDGIAPERYGSNAVALEDSEVCAIGFPGLLALARELPGLQGHFYRMMSREIAREQGMMLQLGSMNAEERLAMFLLNLSLRFAARGEAASEFHLRMTREEIGSYLGLKLETISRTLSHFHEQGLIAVQQKFVRILDRAGLEGVLRRELG